MLTSRHSILSITLLDEKVVNCKELFISCPILIHRQEFLANLYKFELIEFNVILGIDFLSKYQAHIDWLNQIITLRGTKRKEIVNRGTPKGSELRPISTVRAQKLLW